MLDKLARKELKSLIFKLRAIGNDQITPNMLSDGICVILENTEQYEVYSFIYSPSLSPSKRISKYFESWALFSGNYSYPVRSPVAHINEAAYYHNCRDKWVGKYGADRRKLCLHIAECIERDLEAL